MPLHKIKEFDPNYKEHFDGNDVVNYDLYSGDDKVGSVDDLLVDDGGKIRYLVINTGVWILGKKVLLPIGRARVDYNGHRIYVDGLTRSQVENLPEYNGNVPVDYDQEERVRAAYRPMGGNTGLANPAMGTGVAGMGTASMGNAPLDTSTSLDEPAAVAANRDRTLDDRDITRTPVDRDTYTYDRDPDLYDVTDRNHHNLRLYEERLIANKQRMKTGEVAIGKHVETETARVSVPIEKERVVIERVKPTDAGASVAPGTATFQGGEVARMEVYEESPDVRKEAVVREEVRIHKEIDRETVETQETIRREELDVDTDGNPVVSNDVNNPNNPLNRRDRI